VTRSSIIPPITEMANDGYGEAASAAIAAMLYTVSAFALVIGCILWLIFNLILDT